MTVDPVTRAACAEALAGATAETLREDAAYVLAFSNPPRTVHDLRLCRLAALALAVAEMQDKAVEAYLYDRQRGTWAVGRTFAADSRLADSLPAALATLLPPGHPSRHDDRRDNDRHPPIHL